MRRALGVPFVVVSLVSAVVLGATGPASASFTTSTSVAQATISSTTLQAPTGLSAVEGCRLLIFPQVVLSWTATTSTFATGYDILRSTTSGSGYSVIGSVSLRTNVTFTDTTVGGGTTYYYVVRAKFLSWTSVNSGEASATTPASLC